MTPSLSCFDFQPSALCCGVLLAVRILAPGWAWAWVWARPGDAAPPAHRWARTVALIAATGLALALATALAEAALGVFRPAVDWTLTGLLTAGGLLAGWRARRAALAPSLGPGALAAVLLAAGSAAVLLLPQRGEWIAGGWDPGIYVCEGVSLSRGGALQPAPDPFYRSLSAADFQLFTRPFETYTQVFPVVPMNPETRAFQPFFFRLFPTFIALSDRCGGALAAMRINHFAALLTLLILPGMLLGLGARGAHALFAALLLAAHPLWLYHTHFPTSEMLQLTLMCAIGLALPLRAGAAGGALLAGLLFLSGASRVSFVPFGGLLLCGLAWLDLEEPDRRAVARRRVGQIAAVAAGAAFDYATNASTLGRLGTTTPAMMAGFGLLALAAVAVDVAGPRRGLQPLLDRIAWPAALLALALVVLAAFTAPPLAKVHTHLLRMEPFLSHPYLLLAGAAALVPAWGRFAMPRPLLMWLCFGLGATVITVAAPEITPWWPWASRRYLEFTLPMLVILGAAGLAALWAWTGRGAAVARAAAVLLCAAVLAGSAPRRALAWRLTEFDGLASVLQQVAAQVGPRDVVVADHHRWGTPLHFLCGLNVLNGTPLWEEKNVPQMRRALAALRRMQQDGRKVFFLTVSERGLAVYPGEPVPAREVWTSGPLPLREVVQNPKISRYAEQTKPRCFRLFELDPAEGRVQGSGFRLRQGYGGQVRVQEK